MLEKLTKKKNRKGFTLVELIVVIAILGILMLIAVPRFQGFREQSAIKADQATGATIGKAAELYALNHDLNDEGEIKLSDLKATSTGDTKNDDGLIDEDIKLQSNKYGGENKELKDTDIVISIKNGKAIVTANGLELYPDPETEKKAATGDPIKSQD